MAFSYDVSTVSELIQAFVNLIANLVYSLTGYSGDLVGVAVLGMIVAILGGILAVVGGFLAMKWLRKKQ